MPDPDNERRMIDRREREPCEINRHNNPEPVLELELGRSHARRLTADIANVAD